MKVLRYIAFLSIFISTSLFSSTVTKLDYWVLFSGGDARPMQLIVDSFNYAHPQINVKMKVIRWAEYYSTLDKSIKNNTSPEIAIVHASLLNRYIESKSIVNLDSYNVNWNEFSSKLLTYMQHDNSNYAIPLDTHPQLLYFNKKYLKQAGLLDNNEKVIMKSGVSGFIDFYKTLKKKLPANILPISTANLNVYPFWVWYSLYNQQNSNKGYITNNKASFNNEAGRKALGVLKQMRDSNIWREPVHDEKGYNLFKFNKAATMVTGTWATWNFNQNKKLDYGVTIFPTLFDKPSTFADAHTMVVLNKKNKLKQDASVTFIKWLSANSYKWALSGQIPSNNNITSSTLFLELPNRDMYLKAASSAAFYPKIKKLKECNEVMTKILIDFIKSNISVEKTLNDAETKINKILEQNDKI